MKIYKFNQDNFFVGEIDAFIDPLETEKQGKKIYLTPANCTTVKPLEQKDGFNIKYNGTSWEYEKIPEPEPEPEPTPEEKLTTAKQAAEFEIKAKLAATDYKCLKFVDGDLTAAEYEETKKERQALREKFNAVEACTTIKELEKLLG